MTVTSPVVADLKLAPAANMDQNSSKQKTYLDLLQELVIFVIVSGLCTRGLTGDISPFKDVEDVRQFVDSTCERRLTGTEATGLLI